jgi:hypothetical protein
MDSALQARCDAGVQFRNHLAGLVKSGGRRRNSGSTIPVIEDSRILQMAGNPPRYAKRQSDPAWAPTRTDHHNCRLAESLAAFRYDRKTPEGVLTLFAWIQKRLFDTRTIVAGVSSYPPRR